MMRGNELREEVFVCVTEYWDRKIADQTRNRNRRRKSMSGTPAWDIGGGYSESLNDNDTFAETKTRQPG